MNFKSDYIKNEINRLQQNLDNDNRYKQKFIKNKEKMAGLIKDYNDNNLLDKICQQNIFKFCGFEKEGVRIKIDDLVSGYIAFVSSFEEEAEKTKNRYISKYNISSIEYVNTKNLVTEILFKEDLWGKVILSDNKYYLYIYKTIKREDKNYYIRFDCIEFIAFIFKTSLNNAKMLLLNAMNKERKNIVEEYENLCKYNLKDIEEKISQYTSLRVFLLKEIEMLKTFIGYVNNSIYKLKEEEEKLYMYCTNVVFGELINKSGTTAGKYLNTWTVLGFIEKKVDENYNKKNKNAPAKYLLKKFTEEVLKQADKVARLFMLNNIKITDFDEKTCKEIFGEEKTNEIFYAQPVKKKGGKL